MNTRKHTSTIKVGLSDFIMGGYDVSCPIPLFKIRLKQIILTLLVLLSSIGASAQNAWTDENDVTWYFNTFGNSAELCQDDVWGDTYPCYESENIRYNLTIPSTLYVGNTGYHVTIIGNSAFEGCYSLSSITIPDGVTQIGNCAFNDCSGLASITIPNPVTSIGDYAFNNCSSLTSVIVEKENPIGISSNVFSNRANATLYVPAGSKTAYQAANYWKEFKEIVEMSAPVVNITFADANVKALCVANWDTNGDGELSEAEAAAVTGLGSVFNYNTVITSFDELQYFIGVTSIGERAFCGCSALTSIVIPNSVTSIGQWAFDGCSELTSIIIPESVTSINCTYGNPFRGCSGLTSISVAPGNPKYDSRNNCNAIIIKTNNRLVVGCKNTLIPESVTSIWSYAFDGCSGLTSMTIPESVVSIGENAFNGCSGLTSITIPENVTSIGSCVFYGCTSLTSITIPENVTSIGSYMFAYCTSLKSLPFGSSVTNIGGYAFYGCSGLTSVTIGNSVTSIGEFAFGNCPSLISVTLNSDAVVSKAYTSEYYYGDNMKHNFGSQVKEFIIGEEVTSIGEFAFCGYTSLTSVIIPNSVTSIGESAFYGCSGLTSITIPESVTSIYSSAFEGCSGLTSVTIGNSVTSIGEGAFYGCSGLTSITIPEGVTSIGSSAFQGCSGLTSVTIGNSVTSIGSSAFYDCSGLTSVKVDIDNPLPIYSGTFTNRTNATLYVPAGSKAAYLAANYWKQFKEIKEFIEGDVNCDGESDVVDVVDIARYVVGTPAETFVPILADINSSGEVNIGDAVCLVNEIAGDQNFARAYNMPEDNTKVSDELTLTENLNSLSLCLANQRGYTAFQFDLYVPEGVDVMQMQINKERKQKHQLLYNKVEDGHWRVVALSTSNNTFQGNDGELLNVVLVNNSSEGISLSNIMFFDAVGSGYQFCDISLGTSTTIGRAIDNAQSKWESVYTLDGRRINGRPSNKDIYIINGKKFIMK